MAKVTRRRFLGATTAGAAAVGTLIAAPGLTNVADASAPSPITLSREELAGPLVAHVRNLSTGEIALMVGTREIVYHDRKLVARLLRATR